MATAPDTVRVSELKTEFFQDSSLTKHILYDSQPGKRKVRQEDVWQIQRELGSGAFGAVYLERCVRGQRTAAGSVRAVKKIQKGSDHNYFRELEAMKWCSLSPEYQHCFVWFIGWYERNEHICIAMEYLPNGDLRQYIAPRLPEGEAQQVAHQVLEGLSFLHDFKFAHRDLKPANILVVDRGPKWWVKIADFGISKRLTEDLTSLRSLTGTPAFTAPEVLGYGDTDDATYRSYTNAVDIWSVGVITFLMLTGETLFKDRRRLGLYASRKMEFPIDMLQRHSGQHGSDFVKCSMAPRPQDRPNAKDALNHPWFEDMTDNNSEREEPLTQSALPKPRSLLHEESSTPRIAASGSSATSPSTESATEASAAWSTQHYAVQGQDTSLPPPYSDNIPDLDPLVQQFEGESLDMVTAFRPRVPLRDSFDLAKAVRRDPDMIH